MHAARRQPRSKVLLLRQTSNMAALVVAFEAVLWRSETRSEFRMPPGQDMRTKALDVDRSICDHGTGQSISNQKAWTSSLSKL